MIYCIKRFLKVYESRGRMPVRAHFFAPECILQTRYLAVVQNITLKVEWGPNPNSSPLEVFPTLIDAYLINYECLLT